MKNIILYSLILLSSIAIAQDSLLIQNVSLQFNTNNTYLFDDSLDFSYSLSKTGGQDAYVPIRTKVRVENSNWNLDVEEEVLEDTAVTDLDYSSSSVETIAHRIILRSAVFKNGNNTVVIWPEIDQDVSTTNDSIKFIVEISDEQSFRNSPLKELVDISTSKNILQVVNSSESDLNLSVFDISGRNKAMFNLVKGDANTVSLQTGVYFITTSVRSTYYVHKMIIR